MGADFNGDLDVDESDLAGFGFAYSQEFNEADLNDDGKVDTDDLAIFAADFGRTNCPVCP